MSKDDISRPRGRSPHDPGQSRKRLRIAQIQTQTTNGTDPTKRKKCGNSRCPATASEHRNCYGAKKFQGHCRPQRNAGNGLVKAGIHTDQSDTKIEGTLEGCAVEASPGSNPRAQHQRTNETAPPCDRGRFDDREGKNCNGSTAVLNESRGNDQYLCGNAVCYSH